MTAMTAFRLLAIPLAIATVYFTLKEGQWFLWVAGPVGMVFIYFATGGGDKHRDNELNAWRTKAGWPRAVGELIKKKGGGGRTVAWPPPALWHLVGEAGPGQHLVTFQLHPKLAYLAVTDANLLNASEHVTLIAKLEESAPKMLVHPLPKQEGDKKKSTGIVFKKDPKFSGMFIVEGTQPAYLRSWLNARVRKALTALPDVWVRTQGSAVALTLYGRPREDRITKLVEVADVIFGEYGAEGGPSLLPPEDPHEGWGLRKKKKKTGLREPGARPEKAAEKRAPAPDAEVLAAKKPKRKKKAARPARDEA